jgi:hypothetical protein
MQALGSLWKRCTSARVICKRKRNLRKPALGVVTLGVDLLERREALTANPVWSLLDHTARATVSGVLRDAATWVTHQGQVMPSTQTVYQQTQSAIGQAVLGTSASGQYLSRTPSWNSKTTASTHASATLAGKTSTTSFDHLGGTMSLDAVVGRFPGKITFDSTGTTLYAAQFHVDDTSSFVLSLDSKVNPPNKNTQPLTCQVVIANTNGEKCASLSIDTGAYTPLLKSMQRDGTLKAGDYTITVTASSRLLRQNWSETHATVTFNLDKIPVIVVPGVPRNLSAAVRPDPNSSGSGNQIAYVGWTPPTYTGGSQNISYQVYYRIAGGKGWSGGQSVKTPYAFIPSWNGSSGIQKYAKYEFSVVASNSAGVGAMSGTVSQVMGSVPSPVSGLTVEDLGGGKARLSWNTVTRTGITSYSVQQYDDTNRQGWIDARSVSYGFQSVTISGLKTAQNGSLSGGQRFRIALLNRFGIGQYVEVHTYPYR